MPDLTLLRRAAELRPAAPVGPATPSPRHHRAGGARGTAGGFVAVRFGPMPGSAAR